MSVEASCPAESTKVRFASPTAFSRELKRRADAYFEGRGGSRRDVVGMYVKTAVILTWFVASWALLVFAATTVWQAVALAVSLGLSIAGIGMSIQHDANHGAYSNHPVINRILRLTLDVMGVSSPIWRQRHNALHHSYTNIQGVDADLDFGFIARLSPDQRRRPWHRFQHLYLWFLYGFLLPKWVFIDDFIILATRRIDPHRLPPLSRGDLVQFVVAKIFFLGWAIVVPALFHPLWCVAVFHLIAVFTLGVTLSSVFQLAHCVEEAEFPLPAPTGQAMPLDPASHQVETTVGFAHNSALISWYLGGLNYQVEHHLFPRVCHMHYPALSRIVEDVAQQHGIRYRRHRTLRSAIASHFRLLRKLGQPVAEPVSP